METTKSGSSSTGSGRPWFVDAGSNFELRVAHWSRGALKHLAWALTGPITKDPLGRSSGGEPGRARATSKSRLTQGV